VVREQRGQGAVEAEGSGRLAGGRRWRLHPPATGPQSALPLYSLHFTGIQTLSPPVSSDEFRAVLGRFPSGVTVVTTKAGDGSDQGMTVSAFCSLSLEPPLILICIEKTASVHAALTQAGGFVANILSATQEQLARRFAIVDIDRFEGVGFSRSAEGYAILDDVLSVIEC